MFYGCNAFSLIVVGVKGRPHRTRQFLFWRASKISPTIFNQGGHTASVYEAFIFQNISTDIFDARQNWRASKPCVAAPLIDTVLTSKSCLVFWTKWMQVVSCVLEKSSKGLSNLFVTLPKLRYVIATWLSVVRSWNNPPVTLWIAKVRDSSNTRIERMSLSHHSNFLHNTAIGRVQCPFQFQWKFVVSSPCQSVTGLCFQPTQRNAEFCSLWVDAEKSSAMQSNADVNAGKSKGPHVSLSSASSSRTNCIPVVCWGRTQAHPFSLFLVLIEEIMPDRILKNLWAFFCFDACTANFWTCEVKCDKPNLWFFRCQAVHIFLFCCGPPYFLLRVHIWWIGSSRTGVCLDFVACDQNITNTTVQASPAKLPTNHPYHPTTANGHCSSAEYRLDKFMGRQWTAVASDQMAGINSFTLVFLSRAPESSNKLSKINSNKMKLNCHRTGVACVSQFVWSSGCVAARHRECQVGSSGGHSDNQKVSWTTTIKDLVWMREISYPVLNQYCIVLVLLLLVACSDRGRKNWQEKPVVIFTAGTSGCTKFCWIFCGGQFYWNTSLKARASDTSGVDRKLGVIQKMFPGHKQITSGRRRLTKRCRCRRNVTGSSLRTAHAFGSCRVKSAGRNFEIWQICKQFACARLVDTVHAAADAIYLPEGISVGNSRPQHNGGRVLHTLQPMELQGCRLLITRK